MQMRCIAVKSRPFQKKTTAAGVNIRQLLLGFCVLVFGTLFYYFFRSAEHTYFLKFFVHHPDNNFLSPVLVSLGNSLPTFVHVLAFILMTAGLVAASKKEYAFICLVWFVIDVLFELGQGHGDIIVQIIPDWFSDFLFLENARDYFLHGRFDYLDLLSIALGSILAYFLLTKTKYKGEVS